MEYPDGSVPTITKANSGRMSPVRAKTAKEFYEQLSELKKENFNLKLRIFYMEEQMTKTNNFTKDDYATANINFKIEVESLKKELSDKGELLKKASNAMDNLSAQHQDELDLTKTRTEQDRLQMLESIRHEISSKYHLIISDKDLTIQSLRQNLEAMTVNVQKLEQEKQETLIELNQRVADLQTHLPRSNVNLEQEKVDLLEIIDEQREKYSQLEVVLQQLSRELSQKEAKLEDILQKCDDQKAKCESLNKKLKKNGKAQGTMAEKDSYIQDLEKTIQDLEKNVNHRDQRIKELENEVKQINDDVIRLKSYVTELECKCEQNEKDFVIRGKAIQGLTEEAHSRGRENKKLCDRIENLERNLSDVTTELHTYKMAKYDKESSAQRGLLETENYVQKLKGQVSELQFEVRDLKNQLKNKDTESQELLSRLQEVHNHSAKNAEELTNRLQEKDEGLKHLRDKYENEKGAIRQQVRALQQDIQQKDEHLRLMYELRMKIDRLLEASLNKNDTSVIEDIREEIHRLCERLPSHMPTVPSPNADPSPMAASAPTNPSVTNTHHHHLHDLHMSMAGPVTTSTPLTPPRRDITSPRKSKPSTDTRNKNIGQSENVTLKKNKDEVTPTLPPEGRSSYAPILRPALVGSAHPDNPNDLTSTNQSRKSTVFSDRLNRMSEAELRDEIERLCTQLVNSKELCRELQEKLDNRIMQHLIQGDERHKKSPNRASDIIKRLKLELETSKNRLQELERLNSLLMQSSHDSGHSKLKAELSSSQNRLQDQTMNLMQKNTQLTQVAWLVDRLKRDFSSLDTQLDDVCQQVNSETSLNGEISLNIQAQLNELHHRLREKCSELRSFHAYGNNPEQGHSDLDLHWDNHDLHQENRRLKEKLGINDLDDLDSVPNVNDLTNRLVKVTEELNRLQQTLSPRKSPKCHQDINNSSVDQLVEEIVALRNENELLKTRVLDLSASVGVTEMFPHSEPCSQVGVMELFPQPRSQRLSDEDIVQRHRRQIENLKGELDTERQHNRSLMDVINSQTPNSSFAYLQSAKQQNVQQELRRMALMKNVNLKHSVQNLNLNASYTLGDDVTRDIRDDVAASADVIGRLDHVAASADVIGGVDHVAVSADVIGRLDHVAASADVIGRLDHVAASADVIGRLDDVCRLLNEILEKQEDLSGHVTSMEEHVTSQYLSDLKRKLVSTMAVVHSVAHSVNATLSPDSSPQKQPDNLDPTLLRQAEEKCSLAEEKCSLAEEKCSLAEEKCSLAEEKCSELTNKCKDYEHKCSEYKIKYSKSTTDYKELKKKYEEIENRFNAENKKCEYLLEEIKKVEEEKKNKIDLLESEMERIRKENERLMVDCRQKEQLEGELQSRVRELEVELDRSLDENQTLRHDVTNAQDLLNQAKSTYSRKSEENNKLREKLEKNERTILQCTESITSVRSMVKEKDEMIRLLKEKCRHLQRVMSRPTAPSTSTDSEEETNAIKATSRPRHKRKSRSKTGNQANKIANNVTETGNPVIGNKNQITGNMVSDEERLRHHTSSSQQSQLHEDRLLSPTISNRSSPIQQDIPKCENLPLTSDNSESLHEHYLQPAPNIPEISPGGVLPPKMDLEMIKSRLQASENMNETLRAELMLYQHLSETLTSSAGSTPNLNPRTGITIGQSENNLLSRTRTLSSLNVAGNLSGMHGDRGCVHSDRGSLNGDRGSMHDGRGSGYGSSDLSIHLKELRRLREKLEGTIAANDHLNTQLNDQLKQRGSSQSVADSGLVQSLRHQVDSLREELTDVQSQLQIVTEEAESYRTDAERAQLECQNMAAMNRQHRQETERLREDCNHLSHDADGAKNECTQLKDRCTHLEDMCLQSTDRCTKADELRNRSDEDCARIRVDCERLRKECNWRRDECLRLEEEGKRVRLEVQQLRSEGNVAKEKLSKIKGSSNRNLDLAALVEEIGRLRVQLERSISTNQALRSKIEEMISKGSADSLTSSLKILLRQSESLEVEIDGMDGEVRRSGENVIPPEQPGDNADQYPPDSSDSGTCTGNRSLSNSHSSLPTMHCVSNLQHNRQQQSIRQNYRQLNNRSAPVLSEQPMGVRRVPSAVSLTGSGASSISNNSSAGVRCDVTSARNDVIQRCDVLNDEENILSVSMLGDEDDRREMADFELESRDDYLLLPPGGRGSLHPIRPHSSQYGRHAHYTRSVDDLRRLGRGEHVTSALPGRMHRSYDAQNYPGVRVNSDLRFLFAIGRLDDHELAKKQLAECQVILRGVAARLDDRLNVFDGISLVQSAEYNTLKEVSISVDNLSHCVNEAMGLLYQFWTSQLPPRDAHGNYVDLDAQRQNDELRTELHRLKTKYSQAMQTMKSAQKRLHKANKRKEDMEEAIYRQLSQTERVVRQARINMEMKTGVNAADVVARRQNAP